MDPDNAQRRLAAIMFTDIVGSTALMAKSEEDALAAKQLHRAIVRRQVDGHRGELIEAPGDETLSIFTSALDAVTCALAIQDEVEADSDLRLHIGIHSGDVLVEGGEIHGDGVNIAARICSLSEGGGLCVSGEVYQSVRNQPDVEVASLGEHQLKNVGRPVSVYALGRPGTVSVAASPKARGGARFLAVAIAVVLVGLAGLAWWMTSEGDRRTAAPIRSIAVLPFADMSPVGDQEYFGDGIAEEIMGGLSKVEELRVTARTSAFAFKGRNESIQAIGEQLGVGAVVEGSVRKAGDRLRITAQLIRVADGFELWSDSFDRKLNDVFAIQDEIARATVEALKVRLVGTEPLVRPTTGNVRAFELYVTGRHLLNLRTEEGLRNAVGYFEGALEIDENYQLAYVGLADAHALAFVYGYRGEDALSEAERAARRALAIDERSGKAHTSMGFVRGIQWRWDESEAEYREALRLDPAYATAYHWYSTLLWGIGRLEDAKIQIEAAYTLDPLSPIINREAGRANFYAGEFVRAGELLRNALELNSNEPVARQCLLRANLSLGQEPEVFGWFPGQDEAELRAVYGDGGIHALIQRALDMRIAETQRPCTERPQFGALAFALLGQTERMYECLELGVETKMGADPTVIGPEPAFAEYRSEPRFIAILKRMGLEE